MVTHRVRPGRSGGRLAVWANGSLIGTWEYLAGEHQFAYDPTWLTSPASRRLSLSLPFMPGNLPHRGAFVGNFFDNLLPDSETIRRRLQGKFRTPSAGTFDLLAAIGRDCVGAVQLLPVGVEPTGWNRIDALPLDEAGVEKVIDHAVTAARVLGQDSEEDELRISLAGAQEKTALVRHQDRWCKPAGATPTTHIFKLPMGLVGNMRADMSSSVENEWLCARLLTALGFPVAGCEIGHFGQRKALIVERFDRLLTATDDGTPWLARLPQEDFCQALGLPSSLKYQSDGGPGMRELMRLMELGSNANGDKLTFVKAQLAFWLMAATDGHAKNFSIFHERGGGYRMTPLYDVLSIWPIIGTGPNQLSPRRAKLAMALRGKNVHYQLNEIHSRHWQTLALQSGVADAFDQMVALVLQVPVALEEAQAQLPAGFPRVLFDSIKRGMMAHATKFMEELP
jgi:serine/threonine-protein kinase HipA